MDAQVVEKAFDGLSDSFEETLSATTAAITEVTEALLDGDDGAIPMALTSFREELDGMLDEAFDEDSKSSIIGRFDKLVRVLRSEERKAIRDLLDPGSDESPLYRLKRDLKQSVRDEAEGVRRLIGELAEKVVAEAAATEMFEKTAIKGGAFEDILHELTSELVAPYGNATSRTGRRDRLRGQQEGRRDGHPERGGHQGHRGALHHRGEGPAALAGRDPGGARLRDAEP